VVEAVHDGAHAPSVHFRVHFLLAFGCGGLTPAGDRRGGERRLDSVAQVGQFVQQPRQQGEQLLAAEA